GATQRHQRLAYDAASNRTAKEDVVAGETTYYEYDPRNLLTTEWAEPGGTATYYDHDAAQPTTTQRSTDAATYFQYDQRDDLTRMDFAKASAPGDKTRRLFYSGTGERTRLTIGTGTVFDPITADLGLAYDGRKLLTESSLVFG